MTVQLHDKIRHILEATPGLTQKGLAERMGLNPAAVNRMLYGQRKIMVEELAVIEDYLGAKLDLRAMRQSPRGVSDISPRALAQEPVLFSPADRLPVYKASLVSARDVIDWVARHPLLDSIRDAFAVYVDDGKMAPRYFEGELVYIHPGRPVEAGRDALLVFTDATAQLCRVLALEGDILTAQQYAPALRTDYPRAALAAAYAVVGRG